MYTVHVHIGNQYSAGTDFPKLLFLKIKSFYPESNIVIDGFMNLYEL